MCIRDRIAHRLKTVRGAEQILVMEDGKIMEQGTHDQLVGENGLYARLWGLPVSYTHLDVYKRQVPCILRIRQTGGAP